MVVWLQNNVGFTRWGPTESRVEALLEAFRPVREKERDRAQQDVASMMHHPPTDPTGIPSPVNSSLMSMTDGPKLAVPQTPKPTSAATLT